MKPPGGAVKRDEVLVLLPEGCRLNVKLDVLLVVLAMKLKPVLDAWVKG